MLDFPKKRDKTSCLLRNTQRQVSFHMYRSFGIIHVKCYVRMYLVFVFPKRQYCNLTLIILLSIIHLFAHGEVVTSIAI